MRIAFVCWDNIRFGFLKGLYDLFKKHGHVCRAFYEHGPGQDVICRWANFELKELTGFKPDRVIIFNGFAPQSSGATAFISRRFDTYFVERGWLPQDGNIYIDKIGLGGRSSLADKNLSVLDFDTVSSSNYEERIDLNISRLKEIFKPGNSPGIGDYILVPLQLEHDTSITLDSPHFKTMVSLVDFVTRRFIDYRNRIIVKTHPYGPPFNYPGVTVVSDVKMNTLAYYAKAIIGINSTSLIEALVHEKPIISFGRSILSGTSGIFIDADEGFLHPRNVLAFKPDPYCVKHTLFNLSEVQFHKDSPPDWVVSKVLY